MAPGGGERQPGIGRERTTALPCPCHRRSVAVFGERPCREASLQWRMARILTASAPAFAAAATDSRGHVTEGMLRWQPIQLAVPP